MEVDPFGRWPRRLLHVETMTSYCWTQGNTYAGVREPRYNAITYTWGRFAYRSNEKATPGYDKATYLHLEGITWQDDVPRMKSQFTADELKEAIARAANLYGQPADGPDVVDFVWLDIACIDQKKVNGERTEEYYIEIGRQAKIFRGATKVFVWLHGFSSEQLQKWWIDLDGLTNDISKIQFDKSFKESKESTLVDLILRINQSLDKLTQDFWFTSLWTLQEAFLSPHAAILCNDGWNSKIEYRRIKDLSINWNIINNMLSIIPTGDDISKDLSHKMEDLRQRITDKIGFLEAARGQDISFYNITASPAGKGNPLSLLVASHHRTVRLENENDRVYGIMQVYDLQLGKSSPSHQKGTTYTLESLEDQLGAAIIEKYPIASQLIIQSEDCPNNKAWRVNSRMTLPTEAFQFWRDTMGSSPPNSDISATLRAQRYGSTSTLLAGFSGYTSTLKAFVERMREEKLASLLTPGSTTLILDKKWDLKMRQEISGQVAATTFLLQLEWLHNAFSNESPKLLLLDRTPSHMKTVAYDSGDWGISVILVRNSKLDANLYSRVGLLIWKIWWLKRIAGELNLKLPPLIIEYLDGLGDGWEREEGYFG